MTLTKGILSSGPVGSCDKGTGGRAYQESRSSRKKPEKTFVFFWRAGGVSDHSQVPISRNCFSALRGTSFESVDQANFSLVGEPKGLPSLAKFWAMISVAVTSTVVKLSSCSKL